MSIENLRLDENELEPPQLRLGSGKFGRVFESKYKGRIVVYKFMKHAIDEYFFYNEIRLLHKLRHESIPLLHAYVYTPQKMIIIMEKAHGITLYNMICVYDISKQQILSIAYNIITVIAFIHSENIVFRDLKPDNIMVNPITLKICLIDFGLAHQFTNQDVKITGMCGTPGYMAPEIMENKNYGLEVDIFSFGMTLFVLCTASNPTSPKKMRRRLARVPLCNLILACTCHDPKRRPSTVRIQSQLCDLLEKKHFNFYKYICSCLPSLI